MASGLSFAVAKSVVGKLGEIAAEQMWSEASLLFSFKEDFEWLENELSQISGYLQAADELNGQDDAVKKWLAKVTDIAFDAEDIIDECILKRTKPLFSQLIFRYKMGRRIRQLKERMTSSIRKARELKLVHQVLHLSQPSTGTSEGDRGGALRKWSIMETDSPAVAVERKVEEILRLIEDPAVGVVAVIGMGGLGKTFLLQHVYNSAKHRYEHSAWISVSQTCSLSALQGDLAFQVGLEIDANISEVLVAELIHGRLENSRCLIVLDDVWRASVDGNLIQRIGLPTTDQCKIVVTTRSREVAGNMRAYTYEMQPLSREESWDLFCLFAFSNRVGNRPPKHMESLAHQIVDECGMLPLAVKTVGASMANCPLGEWDSKLQQLKRIENGEDFTMKVLKLSYDSLPSHLKACYAYFSFFPEDIKIFFSSMMMNTAIRQDYLIYLWIAEGFVPKDDVDKQFDIGLNYFHQLQNLCLVDVQRDFANYTVHDLLRDLVISISKEHKCEFDLPLKDKSCRRLLLPKKGLTTDAISQESLCRQSSLRTISFSQNPEITGIPELLFDRLRVLRVLDISGTAISTLPECIGKLKLLKVLNMSQTKIKEVPRCVRRLKSLQFLDVSYCKSLQHLPDWIDELQSLSHLDVERCSDDLASSPMPKGISKLLSLRTLRSNPFPLSIEENRFLNVQDVGSLTSLQEISFNLKDERTLKCLENGILEHLVRLRSLTVVNSIHTMEDGQEESTLPTFPEKMSVMKDLQQLLLSRFSVPSWICGMESLTELTLNECSDYPALQNMPNLQTLVLWVNSRSTELPEKFGERGGFPKLARLLISDFTHLEEFPALEDGAMQRLEVLGIYSCPWLKKVPEGLERLSRLKRIELEDAGGELEERIKEGGEDWNKIKANNPHIQIIIF